VIRPRPARHDDVRDDLARHRRAAQMDHGAVGDDLRLALEVLLGERTVGVRVRRDNTGAEGPFRHLREKARPRF